MSNSPAVATATGADQKKGKNSIPNPRRLLILTPTTESNHTIPLFLSSLTGVAVDEGSLPRVSSSSSSSSSNNNNNNSSSSSSSSAESKTQTDESKTQTQNKEEEIQTTRPSFAGYTTHAPLRIETKYYSADVPIWVDEIPVTSGRAVGLAQPIQEGVEGGGRGGGEQWKTEFLSDEARVVRDALGALIICVRNPVAPSSAIPREAYHTQSESERVVEEEVQAIKKMVQIISDVKNKTEEERDGGMGEVPGVLVLMNDGRRRRRPPPLTSGQKDRDRLETDEEEEEGMMIIQEEVGMFSAAWWEDTLYEMGILGIEVVLWDPTSGTARDTIAGEAEEERRNEFGELEGLPRIKEVLAALEWGYSAAGDIDEDENGFDFLNDEDDDAGNGFGLEVGQLEREMMGLRFAIHNGNNDGNNDGDDIGDDIGDTELQVEELDALMLRMRAIRDMSADLPEAQRKAFAAKAVRDIMREL